MADTELFPLLSEQPEGKDVQRIIRQYTRFWYLFVLSIIFCISIAYLYVHYYAIPLFRAYSTILIKDDKSGQVAFSVDALAGPSNFSSIKNIDNEIEILKSKSLMARVISELGLATSYYAEGKLHSIELFGRTTPIKMLVDELDSTAINKTLTIHVEPGNSFQLDDNSGTIASYQFGQQIRKKYGTFTIVPTAARTTSPAKIIIKIQDVQQIASYYNQAVTIQPINRNTSVLIVSLTDPVADKAKIIVNKLVEVYKKEAVEDKNSTASATMKFLDNRLRYLTSDLSAVEKTVEGYKSANGLTDIGTQSTSYTEQASKYSSQLSEWAIQIDVLESIENYLNSTNNRYSTVPSSLGIKDETLLGLIDKFNALQLERERLLRTNLPANPVVQNVNEQLISLRRNILENLHNIKRSLQITSSNLKGSLDNYQGKIKKVPGMERELLEINRQKLIKQNIYSYLLQKREEAALSLAATTSVARVIDPATENLYPVNLNGQVIYLLASILGFILPFAAIYTKSLFNNKIQVQQDVTSLTRVPVIGEIAHNDSKEQIIAIGENRTSIAESFRLIRANIHAATATSQSTCLTFLVTSSTNGEGKTFFSTNLSASLVSTGKKVVLLNLDLYDTDSTIETELTLPGAVGITDYLTQDEISIDDIIRHSKVIPGLSVISANPTLLKHIELIASDRIPRLIDELKRKFDYIIIDTPPVGQVADAFALNDFIDFTIYLVRYGYTQKSNLSIMETIRVNKTLKSPMIVLNDTRETSNSTYKYTSASKPHKKLYKGSSE